MNAQKLYDIYFKNSEINKINIIFMFCDRDFKKTSNYILVKKFALKKVDSVFKMVYKGIVGCTMFLPKILRSKNISHFIPGGRSEINIMPTHIEICFVHDKNLYEYCYKMNVKHINLPMSINVG
jgi:hypothetical protein